VGFEPHDPRLRIVLNNLGVSCKHSGRLDEADRAYRRALAANGTSPDVDWRSLATVLHNVGGLEHARGTPAQGEGPARRGLALREELEGPAHPDVAADLIALAAIIDGQGRFEEAEAMYHHALRLLEAAPIPRLLDEAVACNNLGAIYHQRHEHVEAQRWYQRALSLKVAALGRRHPQVALTRHNLELLLDVHEPLEPLQRSSANGR
jgi:Flp pilus assembly protein TadD